MSIEESRRLLLDCLGSSKSVARLLDQGYEFLTTSVYPSLENLRSELSRTRSSSDREIVADVHSLLGDLYDLLEAPLAAIKEYGLCVSVEPDHGYAWAELSTMYWKLGDRGRAVAYARRSLEIEQTEHARENLDDAMELDEVEYPEGPTGESILEWFGRELLAGGFSRIVLGWVEPSSAGMRQVRAQAWGALGQCDNAVAEWMEISRSATSVTLRQGDWFYLPNSVFESPAIWRAFEALGPRLVGDTQVDPDLVGLVTEPGEHANAPSVRRRQWDLLIKLHLATACRDQETIRQLCERYPTWTAALAQRSSC